MKRQVSSGEYNRIMDSFHWTCAYCGGRANSLDHFIPYSKGGFTSEANLIASCNVCNLIATDHLFNTFDEKRQFIQEKRATKKWRRRIEREYPGEIDPQKLREKLYRWRIIRSERAKKVMQVKETEKVIHKPSYKSKYVRVVPTPREQFHVVKERTMPDIMITGNDLFELRQSLQQSLAEFGWTLKKAMDPKATYPYTRSYISNLEKSKPGFVITKDIQTAYFILVSAQDTERPELINTVKVTVYALPNQIPDGCYIPRTAKWKQCEYPGCKVRFIPTSGTQKYHIPLREHTPKKGEPRPGRLGKAGRPKGKKYYEN